MTTLHAVICTLLCGPACVAGDQMLAEERTLSDDARDLNVTMVSLGDEPDVCELLPDCDGPCAVACDHEALREFVPPGTCVAFRCELVDGQILHVHACRPE